MTTEQQQAIADRTLRKVALQYGSTTKRDFRVIEIMLEQIASVSSSLSDASQKEKDSGAATTRESSASLTHATESEGRTHIPLSADELDWVKHAASLRRLPVAEHIRRAINLAIRPLPHPARDTGNRLAHPERSFK